MCVHVQQDVCDLPQRFMLITMMSLEMFMYVVYEIEIGWEVLKLI